MPDDFQAQPTNLLPGNTGQVPASIDRFAQVNVGTPSSSYFGWRKCALVIVLFVLLLAGVFGVFLHYRHKEQKALEGTWVAESLVVDGDEFPKEYVSKVLVALSGSKFTMTWPEANYEGQWTIDVTRTGEIDFLYSMGIKQEGIYEIDGNTMKLCMRITQFTRPTDFTAEKGSGRILLVMKRQQKEP